MAAVQSHPLRITERDVIKEQSVDEWFNSFKGLDLHIRVLHARDLSPSGGLPDPYCKILCGPARHQTATQRRTLDPAWGEDFYLEWGELAAGKRLITLEVWDWDFWRPDELLGRGFIAINDLAFEPLEVQRLEIKLHPSSVRRPQDIKPPKQHKPPKKQPSKKQLQKQQQQQQERDVPAASSSGSPDQQRSQSPALSGQQQQQQQAAAQNLQQLTSVSSSALITSPSLRHFLQPNPQQQQQQQQRSEDGAGGAAAAAAGAGGDASSSAPPSAQKQKIRQQQQQQQDAKNNSAAQDKQAAAAAVDLGSIVVALWWAPTRRNHGFDVAERVSFCLLPGEVKVPPVVKHTTLGTLYEEPCIVYFKLSLLEVHLGGTWYLEYLGQRSNGGKSGKNTNAGSSSISRLQRTNSNTSFSSEPGAAAASNSSWDGFQGPPGDGSSSSSNWALERSESLEAALAAVSGSSSLRRRSRQQQQQSSACSSPRWSTLQDRSEPGLWGGFEGGGTRPVGLSTSSLFDFLLPGGDDLDEEEQLTPAENLRRQQRQQQLLQQHLAAEPVFALARLQFGKQQVAESIPVRLRPGGAAVFREQFVFATKRPLQNKRLVMEVVLRGKGLPGGKMVARRDWSVVDLLMCSPPPPTTWLGVQALKRCQVPGVLLPLHGIEGSSVELIASAADADGRAAMYGVPPLGLEAAAAAGLSGDVVGGSSSGTATPLRGYTPRNSIDMASLRLQQQQQQQQQAEEPWLGRLLSQQMGWRRTGAGGGSSAPSSPRYPGSPRAGAGGGALSAPSSGRHSNLSRVSPFASDAATAAAAAASAAASVAPTLTAATAVSALSASTSQEVASAAASAAAAAATVAAVEVATAAATAAAAAAAGPGGDIAVPDELSPIPGLPVRPEPGGLSGPLATLQLVIHRVELVPEPSKGWWIVVKVGPHWARSNIRRDADFAWQLSVPIYHPTTTLVMVVYGEAGRGRITFLGKLHYRISYLMYLNHREVVKSLKLRTGSSQQATQGSGEPADGTSGAGGNVSGVVLLSFTCAIPDRNRLMKAYERSPYPPMVHQISLFHAAKRDDILQSHHRKVVAWLSTVADPPIPPVVAWKVLETGRESFKLSRSRHNIQRLKLATSWIPATWGYFTELKAWVRPWHNIISVFVMGCICFYPRFSLFAFLLWRSVVSLRRLLMHSFVEYLGVDLGELFDSAGLLPSDFLYDEGDDDDDAASTTSSSSGSNAWGGGAGGAPGPGGASGAWGGGGGGGGGGVRDLAAVMMFQPRRLQRLKRRYEQLLRISLQVQNRIDDIAMVFERLHAMMTGQDPLATALFFWRCLLLATALWLLGPGPLLFVWWCWEVLRPPSWRKPPGVKGPVQFVINLPSRSLEEG